MNIGEFWQILNKMDLLRYIAQRRSLPAKEVGPLSSAFHWSFHAAKAPSLHRTCSFLELIQQIFYFLRACHFASGNKDGFAPVEKIEMRFLVEDSIDV